MAAPGQLAVTPEQGEAQVWPTSQIALSPRLGSTPRLLRRPGHGHVECPDSPLLDRWLAGRDSRIERLVDWLERRRAAIAVAAGTTVLATVAFVQFGVPALAEVVARQVPAPVERHVSNEVAVLLDRLHFEPTQLADDRRDALRRRFHALVEGEPRAPQMRLEFVAAPGLGPNALALPDGRIFMTDELVELSGDDEELLAVLAHEAGHHVHRHGMRKALESSSVFVAAGVLLGDVSGSSLAVSIPAALMSQGFSRGHEREADAYAFDLLRRRGISPEAFARIMGRLPGGDAEVSDGGVAGYLSSHPPSPERVAAARAAAAVDADAGAGPAGDRAAD